MEKCTKCHSEDIGVSFEPIGAVRPYRRLIEDVTKFMRDDTYYYEDTVKKEHLIYKCKTCGYRIAKECKDKEVKS